MSKKKNLFRPCIDLHQGAVKQIVGSTLSSIEKNITENFTSSHDASYYANLYKSDNLQGGHLIMLGGVSDLAGRSANEQAAKKALQTYPHGLQVGGGIHLENAISWLEQGAQAIIVTSYLFDDKATFSLSKLKALAKKIGKDKIIVDLSCQKESNGVDYYISFKGWRQLTQQVVSRQLFIDIEPYCAECLIHSVAVEGKVQGADTDLIRYLSKIATVPCVYAGGINAWQDIATIHEVHHTSLNGIYYTVGSALDIFGGNALCYRQIIDKEISTQ